jgi:HTH-type transcriptional regulator / antitoxin HigA
MITHVTLPEATANIAQLLDRVSQGEEIIISQAGQPIAHISPAKCDLPPRTPGQYAGKLVIPKDIVESKQELDRPVIIPETIGDDDYKLVMEMLDRLIDRVGEDEAHPLAKLMETIGDLIDDYEMEFDPQVQADIAAAYADYAAGDYVTYQEFMAQRRSPVA